MKATWNSHVKLLYSVIKPCFVMFLLALYRPHCTGSNVLTGSRQRKLLRSFKLAPFTKFINLSFCLDKDNYQMSLGVLLSNRAACHNKIGDCDGCIEDCNKALTLVPSLTKPRSRRAAALETKEKYVEFC